MKLHDEDIICIWCMLIGVFGLIFYDVRQTMDFLVYLVDLIFNSKLIFIFTSMIGVFGFMFFIIHRIIHFGDKEK